MGVAVELRTGPPDEPTQHTRSVASRVGVGVEKYS